MKYLRYIIHCFWSLPSDIKAAVDEYDRERRDFSPK